MPLSTKTNVFSIKHLDVFWREGVKEVEPRIEGSHRGCWVRFENGWTLSIQWGAGNYSDNYGKWDDEPGDSTSAEIAVWGKGHEMVNWGTQDDYPESVQGYCSMDRVQHILDLLAEDKLMRTHQPPLPPPETRAVDGWEGA